MRENAHEVAFDYGIDLLAEEIKSDLQISSQVKNLYLKMFYRIGQILLSKKSRNDIQI